MDFCAFFHVMSFIISSIHHDESLVNKKNVIITLAGYEKPIYERLSFFNTALEGNIRTLLQAIVH